MLPRLTVNPVKHLQDITYRASDSTTWCSAVPVSVPKPLYSIEILNLAGMFYLVSKEVVSCRTKQ